MSFEFWSTFATFGTFIVIAATAIAALVQLSHLRAGNQINAMLSIGSQFDAKEFRAAQVVIQQRLESALENPAYRAFLAAFQRGQSVPAVPQEYHDLLDASRLVGNTYEELGILLKNGIVDKNLFLDRYAWAVQRAWTCLRHATAFSRAVTRNNAIWENFEYLMVLAEDWRQEHREGAYPWGVRRLQLDNPWAVPPMAATA